MIKMKKPLLTISLLISNRLDTIPRCLDSLYPIMDAVPCELILIDTSKNPEVHNLLLEYTDQVYEFEWCNDFAKARNEGLERARGEWFLYLDDDEWFVEVDAIIDFFQSGEYKKYGYANYIVRNFQDADYTRYTDDLVSRMVRLGDTVRFVSKIHEHFTPITMERKDLHARANHDGYIFDTPEKQEAHFQRNHALLWEMFQKEPQKIRWQLQIVQEYISGCKWEELVQFCEERLLSLKDKNTYAINKNIGTFYEGLARGLFIQKKYRECIAVCKNALSDKRAKEVLSAKMYLWLSKTCFLLKEYTQAIDYTKDYLQITNRIDRKSLEIQEQEEVPFLDDVFKEENIKTAYNILICCYLEAGNLNPLLEHYDKLCWNQKVICIIDDVEKYMVKAMWSNDCQLIFLRIIVDVFGNQKLSELFRNEILSQEIDSANEFQRTLYSLEKAIQTLIDGPQNGDMIRYHKALGEYVNALCDWNDFMEQQGEAEIECETMVGYFQAAISINEYLKTENQNVVEALRSLKEAVEALPEIAEGVGRFLNSYGELDKQRAELQKKEMDMLRVQVISQAKTMLEMGQVQAAKQIIGQLSMMFPGDIEIDELTKVLQKKLME